MLAFGGSALCHKQDSTAASQAIFVAFHTKTTLQISILTEIQSGQRTAEGCF
jgi:hypothetical protein